MMRLLLLLVFSLLLSRDYGIYSSAKWYLDLHCEDQTICGYGEGKNYEKSIVRALADIADQINIRVKSMDQSFKESGDIESSTNILNQHSYVNIGNIEITSIIKDFIEESGTSKGALSSEHTETIIKVKYEKGNKSIIVQDYMAESGVYADGEPVEYTDIQTKGFKFNDIIAELKRNNIHIVNKDYIYNKTNSKSQGRFLVRLAYSL